MAEGSNTSYSKSREQNLLKLKEELEEYDYVRFTLVDIVGRPRTRLVPARNAYTHLELGIPFYSGMNGLGSNCETIHPPEVIDNHYCNVKMMADLDTFHPIPWLGGGRYKTAQVFIEPGDYSDIDKTFQAAFTRFVAREQLRRLDELGYSMKSAMEWEYVLINKETEEPIFNKWIEFYSSLLMAEYEDWFTDIDQNLNKAGVNISSMHTEFALGQFEFNSSPEFGIKSADGNVLMKQCIKEMALQKGWQANFMAKISPDNGGSGAHFNFSIWDKETGANAFFDESCPDRLSLMAQHWIAGIMKHAPALTALCCPTTNDYHRLHEPFTPGLINWGIDDRMALLRVKDDGVKGTYMENRLPSGLANPYLIMAGTLAAGIDGVINKLPCPEPNLTDGIPSIPHTLEEALECLEKDQVIVEALGKTMVEWFIRIKKFIDLKNIEGVEDETERLKIENKTYGRTC